MAEDNSMIEKVEQTATRGVGHLPIRQGPELAPQEKAEQLWGLYHEYSAYRRGLLRKGLRTSREGGGAPIPKEKRETPAFAELSQEQRDELLISTVLNPSVREDPLAQRLEGEITSLWQDPVVKAVFVARVKESLREREHYAPSTKAYRVLRNRAGDLEEEYFDLMRNQFLMRQMTPTLRAIDISRNRLEKSQTEAEIDNLELTGGMPATTKEKRGGLDREHADLAALLAYERLVDYRRQYKENGVIFTPSRDELLDEVLLKTSQGTWMQLIGETGTGKTTFAKRTSWILNGEPAQYAAGERWGDVGTLIGSKTFERTEQGDRTFFNFGPLTVALTGCQNSLEMEEVIRTGKEPAGKLVILDELNKFDQDALFGALKVAATLRPGEYFNFKELPGVKLRMARKGVAIVSTMNPATARYERKELDPALDRLFYDGKKRVDYPPMSAQNPELYDIFLGILMDDNGRIRIPRDELAPHYVDKEEDDGSGVVKQELDSDVTRHGVLYRFALAASEIHKSFSQMESVAKIPTDPGFLEKAVLEMEVLVNWMDGYSTQIEGGMSLPAYLEHKLHDFYTNIDSQNDKAIFERVFRHFGFDIATPREIPKAPYNALTPVEIGYLTPKTPREVKRIGEEIIPKAKLYVYPDTGEEVNYLPVAVETEGEQLLPGTIISWEDGSRYRYLGKREDNGGFFVVPLGPGEEPLPIIERPETPASTDKVLERAKDILGQDFLGIEAIRAMEAKLKAIGIDVKFGVDTADKLPPLPYSEEDLKLAKENGEMLVLRPKTMTVNGVPTDITIMEFRNLFDQDPVGNGTHAIYPNTWHSGEDFAEKRAAINSSWALVKKEVLNGSTDKDWNTQGDVLRQYGEELKRKGAKNADIKRRTAFEAMWDTMMYYTNTGDKLLVNVYDWTETKTSGRSLVFVGGFDSGGLGLLDRDPGDPDPYIGVCPSR